MGWIDRLQLTSRSSDETASGDAEELHAPPQATYVAYNENDSEQSTFLRPGAPMMVRSTRSASSAAAAKALSYSNTVQHPSQASCSQQQLAAGALQGAGTTNGSSSSAYAAIGASAAGAEAQQIHQLHDAQQHAAADVAAAAEAEAVNIAGLQQHLRTSSSPAVFYSSARRRPPARHASVDAGYVQHRAMTAVTSLSYCHSAGADHLGPLGGTAAAAVAAELSCPRSFSTISNSSGSIVTVAAAASNEDIEIGWVWPPCLASDAGPVEFAVNVAPAEWLSGKRSLTRVPCWPVSGLALHIVHGEQLLQVVDIDICGTTTVKLQLPPSLTSSNELNFIMVMLVDHGKVGPATQLLTMPSSAADEFCGLFSMLVEHEMLPRSAAHPEFVSLLFGSSGCSSTGTLPTVSGKLAYEPDAAGVQPSLSAAACWDAGTPVAAAAALSPRQQPLRHPLQNHCIPASALLQGSVGGSTSSRVGRHQHRRRRRHSTTLCIAGRPSVVQKWSNPAQGNNRGTQRSEPETQGSAAAAAPGWTSRRERRASDSDACLHLVTDKWTIDEQVTTDFGSLTIRALTGVDQPYAEHGAVDQSTGLSSSTAAAITPEAADTETVTYTYDSSAGRETLADELESVSTIAAAAAAAQAAGLIMFVDDADASSDCSSVATPSGKPDKSAASHQQSKPEQFTVDSACAAAAATQTGSRKSLSLDRCAMHVHNEVDRAQRTRTRLSLDEAIWSLAANRASNSVYAQGNPAGGPATSRSSWIAAGLLDGMWKKMGLHGIGSDGAAAAGGGEAAVVNPWEKFDAAAATAAAAAGSASMSLTGTAAAASVTWGLRSSGGGVPASALPTSAAADGSSSSTAQPAATGAAAANAAAAVAAAAPKLERRTATEANLAAAFTAAWTRHMLELASDLQYLVVCVPWAFAAHFEAWFGRIVSARESADGRDSFLAQQNAEQRAESSWDSGMYMRRLGEVMDTLQMHNMWVTMSLLLQHCWQGGLDLYPAGQLFTHLQQQQQHQQQQQQPWTPYQHLDPDLLSPEFLLQIGLQNLGPASGWIRPVPADPQSADQDPTPGNLGRGAAAAAGASSRRSSFSSAADLSKGMAAERAAAAAAAKSRRRSIDQPASGASNDISGNSTALTCGRATSSSTRQHPQQQRQQRRQQQQRRRRPSGGSSSSAAGPARRHHAPRRSISWPLGVLYSALSWAQNAQRKHRQRTTWQRAWQLHTLHEESERGSTSSAYSSSFDTYRSSTSTTRSSCAAAPASGVGNASVAAAAGRSSRGSMGVVATTAAATAASTPGLGPLPRHAAVSQAAPIHLQHGPSPPAPGSISDQLALQQQQQQQPWQRQLLQQALARHDSALALAMSAAAATSGEHMPVGAAAGSRNIYSADDQPAAAAGATAAAAAAADSLLLPAWQQQQQQNAMHCRGQEQQRKLQQHWSEPGSGAQGAGYIHQRSLQQQQHQLQNGYQLWLASDTAPAVWPATSHTSASPAGGSTIARTAGYTAGHTSASDTGGRVTPALYSSLGANGEAAGSSSSVDGICKTAEQQCRAVALQSSLFGPAPLPKAKVQGLQAGLFAQARLPEQQIQALEQQQREREQQLAQQQQQQQLCKSEGISKSHNADGVETSMHQGHHHQQQQQQEDEKALLVNSAGPAAALQAAAIQAAAAAAMQAAAAEEADSAARATTSTSSSSDHQSRLQQPAAELDQQQHLPQELVPDVLLAEPRESFTDNQQKRQQHHEQPHGRDEQQQQQQQQQPHRARPSFDYAPHTPREKQPYLSFSRVMRRSCDYQHHHQLRQQQRGSIDLHRGVATEQQQQQQAPPTARSVSADLWHQQHQMLPGREKDVSPAHVLPTAARVQETGPLTAAGAVARKHARGAQQAVTHDMLQGPPDDPGHTKSSVYDISPADLANWAVQEASSLAQEAVQHHYGSVVGAAAVQGRYETQAAEAAAAALAAASALAVATRVEQAVGQLLVPLVLLYCLCYLPSLLPGLQPQHIEAAMAARPGWFEPVLLVLLAVHMYLGKTPLGKAQTGPNPSQSSTTVSADANSSGSSSSSSTAEGLAAAAGDTTARIAAAAASAGTGLLLPSGTGSRSNSFTSAKPGLVGADTDLASSSATAATQQQRQPQCFAPTRKQQRQERQRQRRRLARQQVLLLRCALSAVAGAAAAGMSCYSLWLFGHSSVDRWELLHQQCGWDKGSTGAGCSA